MASSPSIVTKGKVSKASFSFVIYSFLVFKKLSKYYNIEHLIYASSSSVYGESSEVPFKTNQQVDNPISLYAATKKSNELMAHAYSHLFNLKTTGLRFFTVYGPWGRPDMSLFLFVDRIIALSPYSSLTKFMAVFMSLALNS